MSNLVRLLIFIDIWVNFYVIAINIKDFFYSEWVNYAFAVELSLDLSYREKYAQQLKEVKQVGKGGE